MKVVAIGDRLFVRLFELMGAVGYEVSSPEEARELVHRLIEREDVGLIVLPERFLEAVKPIKEMLLREGRVKPTLAFLPDLIDRREYRVEELRRALAMALGIELRL